VDGAVTRLSPYLSRGVLSTRLVADSLVSRGFSWEDCESLVKELAWRDYFQQVWKHKGNAINQDLRYPQLGVRHHRVSAALVRAETGIAAIDSGVKDLYKTGYMHNHVRMYTAALACNVGGSHWLQAARWMFYHLLDGDWASNALSWQWVAGAFSTRKYYANQDNINKYCYTRQRGTFLDQEYDALTTMQIPSELEETILPDLQSAFPQGAFTDTGTFRNMLRENAEQPVLLYNFYQLHPRWSPVGTDSRVIRVLLWEPELLVRYPISERVLAWIKALADQIPGLVWVSAPFAEVFGDVAPGRLHYKEHPITAHYHGHCHVREWLFPEVDAYYPSFSGYWRRCEAMARAMFR
jgi:deoxyribodipyrimidine photo-lyase